MNAGTCANPACGKPFTFQRRDYTTRQIYCRKECRIAAQAARQQARREAHRAANPPAPRKTRPRKVSADRPRAERRAVVTAAVVEARRMVAEETCPDCGAFLAHDEALVFCRLRAVGRCDWMRLLTQRDRDPARDTDAPDPDETDDDTTDPEPTHEPEESEPMTAASLKPTKRRATTRDPNEARHLILTALAGGPMGPSAISVDCGLAKSVVYRYLKLLCDDGLVTKTTAGIYRLAASVRATAPIPSVTPAPIAVESAPAAPVPPTPAAEGFGFERLTAEARQAFARIASRGLRALLARVEAS